MFRVNYTNLNRAQVVEIVGSNPAPTGVSKPCKRLVGEKIKIVTDKLPVEGPELEYEFPSESLLSVRENGADAVECAYGALSMRNITLFTHMLPGTQRGYNVILNWDTAVVTVFEMWFIDYEGHTYDSSEVIFTPPEVCKLKPFINREVQRQCYTGYWEREGEAPPEERDRQSLRMSNFIIDWKDDRGNEEVVTYTSSIFSTFIEIDKPDGEDVITVPSDMLQIGMDLFIYCRGEVEYSGRLQVEVLDIMNLKKIGVSIGIDENDAFEYRLYTAFGRKLGQLATFYDFNDGGNTYPTNVTDRVDFSVKGARATYRPSLMIKDVTMELLDELSKTASIFDPNKEHIMISANRMEESRQCAGKHLFVRFDDGYAWEYEFLTDRTLRYRPVGDEKWYQVEYRASKLDEDLVLLGHYQTSYPHPACLILALDFSNGCATCIDGRLGGRYQLRDVDAHYHFGVIEMEGLTPPRLLRHGFTRDLLGRSFTWTYSKNMSSQHIYGAPHSYSWTIFTNNEPGSPANRSGGFVWSSPCEYIKLREDVYIMNWVEEKWEGIMGCKAMNLRLMQDCGFDFGVAPDASHIVFDQMGAIGRDAGQFDLSGIYTLKHL